MDIKIKEVRVGKDQGQNEIIVGSHQNTVMAELRISGYEDGDVYVMLSDFGNSLTMLTISSESYFERLQSGDLDAFYDLQDHAMEGFEFQNYETFEQLEDHPLYKAFCYLRKMLEGYAEDLEELELEEEEEIIPDSSEGEPEDIFDPEESVGMMLSMNPFVASLYDHLGRNLNEVSEDLEDGLLEILSGEDFFCWYYHDGDQKVCYDSIAREFIEDENEIQELIARSQGEQTY